MGNPLVPIMAGRYMNLLFNTCMDEIKECGIICIHKYVVGILIIGTREEIDQSQDMLEKQAHKDK